jgi:cell wall-associated NlpC family hydrolase
MTSKIKLIQLILLFLLFDFSLNAQNKTDLKKQVDRNELIQFAQKQIGKPYVFSSADPNIGFDCSGFVYYVFKKFDINVPRSSREYKDLGVSLTPEQFKIGDVIVFYGYQDNTSIGHLGIIIEANGMNSKFIHASSGKVMRVTTTDLNTAQYTKRFYKVISVL